MFNNRLIEELLPLWFYLTLASIIGLVVGIAFDYTLVTLFSVVLTAPFAIFVIAIMLGVIIDMGVSFVTRDDISFADRYGDAYVQSLGGAMILLSAVLFIFAMFTAVPGIALFGLAVIGLMFVARKVFDISRKLNTHVKNPDAHKSEKV